MPEICTVIFPMFFILSPYTFMQFEDVAINAKVQDPQLNTVECVVEGHNDFSVKIFSGFRKLLMCTCWCILIISTGIGYIMSNTVVVLVGRKVSHDEETTTSTPTERSSETDNRKYIYISLVTIQDEEGSGSQEDEEGSGSQEAATAESNLQQRKVNSEAVSRLIDLQINYFKEKVERQREKKKKKDKDEEEKKKKEKSKVKSIKILMCILAVTEYILAVFALGLACSCEGWVYPLCYLAFLHIISPLYYYKEATPIVRKVKLFLVLFGPIGCVLLLACKCLNKTSLFHTITHLTFVMSIHHLLWILIGVMTEPLWAVPVLVLNGCIWFCIYILACYLAESENIKTAIAQSFAVVVCVVLALLVLGVTAHSFLGSDPLTGIVSGALGLVGSWFLKNLFKN